MEKIFYLEGRKDALLVQDASAERSALSASLSRFVLKTLSFDTCN